MPRKAGELQRTIGRRAVNASSDAVTFARHVTSRVNTRQGEVHLAVEHVLHAEGVEIGILVGAERTVVAEMEVAATPLEGVLAVGVGPAVMALVNVLRSTEGNPCEGAYRRAVTREENQFSAKCSSAVIGGLLPARRRCRC